MDTKVWCKKYILRSWGAIIRAKHSRIKITNLSKSTSNSKDLPEFLGSEQFYQKKVMSFYELQTLRVLYVVTAHKQDLGYDQMLFKKWLF